MRTVVCANCHVEYYFAGEGKYLTFPWDNGTKVEEMWQYYTEVGFSDWVYPDAQTPMIKAQHPEYEMCTAGSTHYNAGVSCADCHMPYVREGAAKYSVHDIHSPLLNPTLACGQCHTDTDSVVRRVNLIQEQAFNTKIAAEDAIIDAVNAIKAATANSSSNAALLDEARLLHRQAQFYWDYVSAENSMGFHNPEYVLKSLAGATNLACQSQMKAAQAANDPSLLQTGTYYHLVSKFCRSANAPKGIGPARRFLCELRDSRMLYFVWISTALAGSTGETSRPWGVSSKNALDFAS